MTYQHRNVAGSFVIGRFAAESMVPQVISVVGGEDNHRVVSDAFLVQRLNNTADFVVNLFNQTGIVGTLQHVMFMCWTVFVLSSVPRFPG